MTKKSRSVKTSKWLKHGPHSNYELALQQLNEFVQKGFVSDDEANKRVKIRRMKDCFYVLCRTKSEE